MKLVTLLLLAIVVGFVLSEPLPVPSRPEGYLFRASPDAKVRLDVYEDIQCSDCQAFDPPFKAFLNTTHEGRPITDFIEVVFHTYILPVHTHSFTISQLQPFIWDLHHDGEILAKFNEWCFEHLDEYKGEVWYTWSQNDVIDKICSDTAGLFGYTEQECHKVFKERTYVMTLHSEQKYGAYQRVYSTPGVFINSVQITDIPSDAKSWESLMLPFVK